MAHKNEHIDWDASDQERVSRAVRRKVRRRRRKFPALLLLLCLVLFCGGFILGQATEQAPAKSEDPAVADGADQTDGAASPGPHEGNDRGRDEPKEAPNKPGFMARLGFPPMDLPTFLMMIK